jgi:hypothetical protein
MASEERGVHASFFETTGAMLMSETVSENKEEIRKTASRPKIYEVSPPCYGATS